MNRAQRRRLEKAQRATEAAERTVEMTREELRRMESLSMAYTARAEELTAMILREAAGERFEREIPGPDSSTRTVIGD